MLITPTRAFTFFIVARDERGRTRLPNGKLRSPGRLVVVLRNEETTEFESHPIAWSVAETLAPDDLDAALAMWRRQNPAFHDG